MSKQNREVGRIIVVYHAGERLLARQPANGLTRENVDAFIEKEVRNGIKGGRFLPHKPKVFRLYGDSKGLLSHPDDHCVWTEDRSLAWIVRRTGGDEVVMTTLTRARALKGEG